MTKSKPIDDLRRRAGLNEVAPGYWIERALANLEAAKVILHGNPDPAAMQKAINFALSAAQLLKNQLGGSKPNR